jgi:sterol desaturase/sphingolipid hydroxylase (fatty acid hydroxylase superfamily)
MNATPLGQAGADRVRGEAHAGCSNPEHYELNLGNNFTFWDRLFGTYFDPDTLETKEIVFGIGETPSLARLIAGV